MTSSAVTEASGKIGRDRYPEKARWLHLAFLSLVVLSSPIFPTVLDPMTENIQAPVQERNINAFLEKLRHRLPNWNGNSWDDWVPMECAEAVRAIALDYLENYGSGHDWQEAARHAEFVLTAAYNDIASHLFAGQTPSRQHDMHVRIAPHEQDEAFEILLTRPTEFLLPPVPAMGGVGVAPSEPLTSLSSQATGRAPARFDATMIKDEPILQALDHLSAFLGSKDRISLIIIAAMLVRWRGCQVSQVIQGGVTYRGITNPTLPNQPPGDARLLYARIGPRMNQALSTQGPMANVVMMVA